MTAERYDVLIIGAGPVGSAAANLAAARGLRCLLIDRSTEVFPLPRAIHFDADVMRIFQSAGLAERIEPLTRSTTGGVHLGVDGEPIRVFRVDAGVGDLGWRPHYMFSQPELDALLRGAAREREEVDVLFGWTTDAVEQTDAEVRLRLSGPDGETAEVSGRYAIAADGASSAIRAQLGVRLQDDGFEEPWVIVDGQVPDPGMGPDHTIMYCDPARPGTYVPGPKRHRRWEFMVLPGERDADVSAPETIRALVGAVTPWLDVDDLEFERVAVYRFHALVAERWSSGRVFLAGDAAHQTPPFYGQGMCHGIRDVSNVLWKIAGVLDGSAPPALLDSYEAEREPHVRTIIDAAVTNGRYICTLDPEVARQRDADLRERMTRGADARAFREIIPGLAGGLLDVGADSEAVGLLFVQPTTTTPDGRVERFDELLGDGFALVTTLDDVHGPELDWLTDAWRARLVVASEPNGAIARWMAEFDCVAALVRPDHYVFGVARRPEDIGPLISGLRRALPNDAAILAKESS
jgi:3-(3-hydroxy-phenyl)propionate hydroxylase